MVNSRCYGRCYVKNRQAMTAGGYCCYYLEHCSKTNHIAIKGVIKRDKYENVFGLISSLLKTCQLVSCTSQNMPISKFVKKRLTR